MQLFRNLDIFSFVRISRLNLIGRVNRTDSKGATNQVFNDNPQGSRLRGRPKNRWWNFEKADINKCKIKNWDKSSKNSCLEEVR
jgi:hypothetical protein